ncbi:MAG: rhomboid family intramembrane serine protease [candidate division Zixibacteria bacterium HGW-Zixibacteria-1]|nr:MAG: rhomboid family intramembrane serine protease [candidate division Zixibacteria bacterium HGW-Zixibacteria-1]
MFFPIKDENPTVNKPYVTVSLIVINVLVYMYTFPMNAKVFQIFMYKFGLIPFELVHLEELTPRYAVPILLTPLTSMFVHGGFMHLFGNMLFLWIFGNNIEDYLGPVKFTIFYFVSGLAAVFLFVLFGPNSQIPLIGASGAIAGVLGAYLVLFPRARIVTLIWLFFIQVVRIPAKFLLGFWFFYQLLMSAMGGGGGVAWLAHVGGFAFGYLWFRFVAARRRIRRATIEL